MKNHLLLTFTVLLLFSSCTKNDPIAEVDQEQLSSAILLFTPVEREIIDGKTIYTPIEGEKIETIRFEAPSYLPEVGTHVDLHIAETYKLELKTTDFSGRESQQTFLNRPENHQAFLLGADVSLIDFEYADETNVGITAYITVKKTSNKLVLNYIMRHLNTNVKQNIKSTDWNNKDYKIFSGANDLDLKFEAHFVEEHEH